MNTKTMEETKQLAEEPEICIWIDKYDDVFSDFDSRPFTDRALSDDFLREVHKITSEKASGDIRLKFHLFDAQRNSESEAIISRNLNHYFGHLAQKLNRQKNQVLHKGYMLLGVGFV